MDFKIENGYLTIKIPESKAKGLNLFALANLIEAKEALKTPSKIKTVHRENDWRPINETIETLMESLNDRFTTSEALAEAGNLGLSERTIKRFLLTNDEIVKVKHGHYRKISAVNRQEFIDFEYYERIVNESFGADKDSAITATAIFEILHEKEGGMLSIRKLGQALKRMGYEKKAIKRDSSVRRFYCLKQITRCKTKKLTSL